MFTTRVQQSELCLQVVGGKTFKLKFGHHGGNHPIRHNKDGAPCSLAFRCGVALCFPLLHDCNGAARNGISRRLARTCDVEVAALETQSSTWPHCLLARPGRIDSHARADCHRARDLKLLDLQAASRSALRTTTTRSTLRRCRVAPTSITVVAQPVIELRTLSTCRPHRDQRAEPQLRGGPRVAAGWRQCQPHQPERRHLRGAAAADAESAHLVMSAHCKRHC